MQAFHAMNDRNPKPRLLRRLLAGPSPEQADDRLRLRRWFVAFICWMALLTLSAQWASTRVDTANATTHSLWLLSVGLFYLSLCCLFFPAPTAWIVMLLASNELGIELGSPTLRIVVVAGCCAVATGVANLNEYHIITFLLRYGRVGRVRNTRVYRWAARWFGISPFAVVALFGFLPLPVDVIRWLAIIYRYKRTRYFAAYVTGRFPRYLIWASSAVWLDLDWWQILTFQAVLVLIAAALVFRSLWRRRRAARADSAELAVAGQIP
jgi:membrane protein YqaA with SNARE-associated domain